MQGCLGKVELPGVNSGRFEINRLFSAGDTAQMVDPEKLLDL